MKVLIIEDEIPLQITLVDYLALEKYTCEVASDYKSAIEKLSMYSYDCVVVDLMLPDGNGLDIIRYIKNQKINCGVIVVSAKDTLDDRISGLELGSDDYLTKPFHLAELNARIRSIIRRRTFEGNNSIVFHEISLDTSSREVKIHSKPIVFTTKEFDILLFFISNQNRVLTKDSIAEHLWGDHMDQADSYDFIYAHIKNVRKKLIQAGSDDYIQTVYGIGYKFSKQ